MCEHELVGNHTSYVLKAILFLISVLRTALASLYFGEMPGFSMHFVLVTTLSVSSTFWAATVEDQLDESLKWMPSAQVQQVPQAVWHKWHLGQSSHFDAYKTMKNNQKGEKEKELRWIARSYLFVLAAWVAMPESAGRRRVENKPMLIWKRVRPTSTGGRVVLFFL